MDAIPVSRSFSSLLSPLLPTDTACTDRRHSNGSPSPSGTGTFTPAEMTANLGYSVLDRVQKTPGRTDTASARASPASATVAAQDNVPWCGRTRRR